MSRLRRLSDPVSGKRWSTRIEGDDVVLVSGAPGKEKETRKSRTDPLDAWNHAEQEERTRLRKGFVLVDPDAPIGAPVLLRALNKGYTGALPVIAVGERVLCTTDADDGTQVLLISDTGEVEPVATLASHRLVWKFVHRPGGEVLALVDHTVGLLNVSGQTINEIVPMGTAPAGFLSVAGTRAAWFDDPDIVVVNRDTAEVLLRVPCSPQLYAGHTHQLEGALSSDGGLLAVCSRAGEIRLMDVATGQPTRTISGDFEMVSELHFSGDGRWLLALEQYGRGTLRCFEVATGEPRAGWPELGDLGDTAVAVDGPGRRVAIADQGSWLRILDLDSLRLQTEFRVDQVGRRFAAAWLGEGRIATRTDLGFVGIYAVPGTASAAARDDQGMQHAH